MQQCLRRNVLDMASGQDLGKMQRKKSHYIYTSTLWIWGKTLKTSLLKQKNTWSVGDKVQRLQPEGSAWILADFGPADFSWLMISQQYLYVVLRTVSLQYLALQNMLLFLHFCMLFPTFVFTCLSFWERCKMISITSASDLHVQFTKTPKLLSYSQLQTKQQTASFHGPIFHCRW